MAAGLSAALTRFMKVIENCDSDTKWKKSEQRLSTLQTEEVLPGAAERKYWVMGKSRGQRPVVAANKVTTINSVFVELSRFWGKGTKRSKDFIGLHQALEAQADIVEQSLLFPNNWDRADTGVILVNLVQGTVDEYGPLLLWVAEFEVLIRQDDVSTLVA